MPKFCKKEQKFHFNGSLFARVMDFLNQHITQPITQHNQIHQTCRQLSSSAYMQNSSKTIRGRNIGHYA